MNRSEINCIVEGLTECVGSNNLNDIIDFLNIKVISTDGESRYIKKNDKQIIFLNSSIDEEIKPFILAHEIAHAVLHEEELIHYSPFDIIRSQTEREADYFAFKLLGKVIDPVYDYTAEQYAMELGVNEEVVEYVIKENV